MNKPHIVFYEHDFSDSQVRSLSKSVLNLGNECRALAEENARLTQANIRLTLEKEVYEAAIITGVAIIPDAREVKP